MANWKAYSVNDVLEKIEENELVLPVVQRDLVWKENSIALLFDTLLKGDSFGGIMTIKDIKGREPLFAYRDFIKNYFQGVNVLSRDIDKLEKDISYVVDGQQRLSAFYIGLKGTYNNKDLYFDLLGESVHRSFNLQFAKDSDNLKKKIDNHDGTIKIDTYWFSVKRLYKILKEVGFNPRNIIDDICDQCPIIINEEQKKNIEDNLHQFNQEIAVSPNIGICDVRMNLRYNLDENRQHVVELFRRLNQGGTRLDGMELMASKLKAFSYKNERFLSEMRSEFLDIGFSQDEIIKLIFILQNDHKKTISSIDKNDSDFIQNNSKRIIDALEGVRRFLKYSCLYNFFNRNKPSIIPLYFIGYFLFHLENENISNYFDNYDTNNPNYIKIKKWLIISLLERIFRRRGAGWTAYTTGIRKILNIMINSDKNIFPINELFQMYDGHGLNYHSNVDTSRLSNYDFDLVMYIIYDSSENLRINDTDHLHPVSIIEDIYDWEQINSIPNFQLLDFSTNRGLKRDKELYHWYTEYVKNKDLYRSVHLLPDDVNLYKSENFLKFLSARSTLIIDKIIKTIQ